MSMSRIHSCKHHSYLSVYGAKRVEFKLIFSGQGSREVLFMSMCIYSCKHHPYLSAYGANLLEFKLYPLSKADKSFGSCQYVYTPANIIFSYQSMKLWNVNHILKSKVVERFGSCQHIYSYKHHPYLMVYEVKRVEFKLYSPGKAVKSFESCQYVYTPANVIFLYQRTE